MRSATTICEWKAGNGYSALEIDLDFYMLLKECAEMGEHPGNQGHLLLFFSSVPSVLNDQKIIDALEEIFAINLLNTCHLRMRERIIEAK